MPIVINGFLNGSSRLLNACSAGISAMPDRYEPPTDPVPWPAHQPERVPDRQPATQSWYPDYPARYDGPAGEARSQGLRRLSKLTWRAPQLSAVAAVGF